MSAADHAIARLFWPPSAGVATVAGPLRVLVGDEDESHLRSVLATLADLGCEFRAAATLEDTRTLLRETRYDAVLLHRRCDRDGWFDLVVEAGSAAVIVFSDTNDAAATLRAWQCGAAENIVVLANQAHLRLLPHALERAVMARQTKAALLAGTTHFRHILDSIPSAIFICDRDGYIVCYNRHTVALWGREPRLLDPADRFCASVRMVSLEGQRVDQEGGWHSLRAGGSSASTECVAEFSAERQRRVRIYASPMFDAAGELLGTINVWMDMTEMRHLEHRQRLLESQLAHAHRLKTLGSLAGGIAHDFNNQLATILGVVQLADLDLPPASGVRTLLQEALTASRRGRDIVQRLQQFCHDAQGELSPQPLDEVVNDAVQILRPTLPSYLRLETRLSSACLIVACCPEDLHEVLAQLVQNAVQAFGLRPGLIVVALEPVVRPPELNDRIPTLIERHLVCLSVQDNGPGMPEAIRSRLFEPVFSSRQCGQGSGLGLAVVYGIVKRHEGSILVDSIPGIGTTIRIFLPSFQRRESPAPGSLPSPSSRGAVAPAPCPDARHDR